MSTLGPVHTVAAAAVIAADASSPSLLWIILMCGLGFMALWLVICVLISRLSGWHRLAQTYRASSPLEGTSWGMQSAALRFGASYNNCVRFTVNPLGMGMAVAIAFAPGHPRLFFPWAEIRVSRQTRFWGPCVVCTFQREPSMALQISPRLAARIQTAIGPAWPESPAAAS